MIPPPLIASCAEKSERISLTEHKTIYRKLTILEAWWIWSTFSHALSPSAPKSQPAEPLRDPSTLKLQPMWSHKIYSYLNLVFRQDSDK